MRENLLVIITVILVAANIVLLFAAMPRTDRSPEPLRKYISGTNIKSLR